MKTAWRLLLCAAALLCLLAAPAALAAPARPMEYFTISDYNVNIVIDEANVFAVSETITVRFTEPRHGIYRDIPVAGTLYRSVEDSRYDATKYRASVSDVRVEGYDYEVSREGDSLRVRIGSADTYVEGEQVYRISYKWAPGNDRIPDFDEVYYNIIGGQWNTAVERVTFSVTLPKPFDASRLGMSMGSYASSGYDPEELSFSVDGNTVKGQTLRPLSNYEALTMRVELPQGYFKAADPRVTDWIVLAAIGLIVLGSLLLFFFYGRDDRPVQTVEFHAPEGMTPSEVGYIIDGSVDNRDVVSLILYWADRGYLTIEDIGHSKFMLHKVKDMGGDAKPFEHHMFTKLFKDGPDVSTGDLQYTFYKTVNSTKAMVENAFSGKARRVFTKTSMALVPLLSFFTALPVMMTLALNLWRDTFDVVETSIVTAIVGALVLLPVFFVIGTMRRWRGEKPAIRIVKLFSFLFLCFIAVVVFLLITAGSLTPALPWTAVLATVVIGLASVFIIKRTPQGTEWLGKILGFREFIELAERDRLVALVEQNPAYFYNVLPYAWVLNVTDKWARKFETIAMEPPQWYYGYNGSFHPIVFAAALNHSMSTFQSQMTSVPSSSGGGGGSGFSGGGFSGGGGGGGGGGSW